MASTGTSRKYFEYYPVVRYFVGTYDNSYVFLTTDSIFNVANSSGLDMSPIVPRSGPRDAHPAISYVIFPSINTQQIN